MRISNICDLYNNIKEELDRKYKYFSDVEAESFILKCGGEIEKILIQHSSFNTNCISSASSCTLMEG